MSDIYEGKYPWQDTRPTYISVEDIVQIEECRFCRYFKKLTTNDNFGKCGYPTPWLTTYDIDFSLFGAQTAMPITHKTDYCDYYDKTEVL